MRSEQRLAKYDTNHDGVLDADEQQRMRDEEELAQLQAVLGGVVTHEPDGATSLVMAYIDEVHPGECPCFARVSVSFLMRACDPKGPESWARAAWTPTASAPK